MNIYQGLCRPVYPGASLPAPIAASILGVSAVAHVRIGVADVLRIRAGELARERRKLSAINRLAGHNLRNEAQVLLSAAGIVDESVTDDRGREAANRLADSAQRVAEIDEKSVSRGFEVRRPTGVPGGRRGCAGWRLPPRR